jgi:hypothetical protein
MRRRWTIWAAHGGDVIGPAISAHHRFVMDVGGAGSLPLGRQLQGLEFLASRTKSAKLIN